jgi:hypothetical protein
MSLEHAPIRDKTRVRRYPSVDRVCVSVNEFAQATGISRAALYRKMAEGHLKFAHFGGRRVIPVTEYARLGLSGESV